MDSPVIRKAEDNQLGHTDGDGDGHRDARGVHPSFRSVPTSVSAYNPAEFANLRVSDDVRGVLAHIGAYTPADRVLAATVRHGIPEMQPAVHPPDDFIKPPRPDGATETLGLRILDEPAPLQSDPVLLDLQMRAASRRSVSNDSIAVRTSTARGAQLSREINAWIAAMNDLHRSKPSVSVAYARTMPDLDSLMQEWDAPFDELLGQVRWHSLLHDLND